MGRRRVMVFGLVSVRRGDHLAGGCGFETVGVAHRSDCRPTGKQNDKPRRSQVPEPTHRLEYIAVRNLHEKRVRRTDRVQASAACR
jgi:hypothetical protein